MGAMTNSTEFETILVDVADHVATITINRPKALNALNSTVLAEVTAAAEKFDSDAEVGAIVLIGSEKAFAAGADIKEMKDQTYPEVADQRLFAEWEKLASLSTPLITAVSGFALGGGCEVAMLGDILLASESATFGQPEINLGVIPGMGGTQRLTRAVGKYKAMDLILTGRMMKADEAERAGLVSRVLPTEGFAEEVHKIAAGIASKSHVALEAAKKTVDAAYQTTLTEGVELERQQFWKLFATEDQKEGMSAFVEKRDPEWKHR
ncbi:enoyl-CoA hydratase [Corynebacterium sp. zg254]|uniref:Enoyl-CoA hydratase n=2 Tax=Corynebacteriaceae TaxID=1653 RepID=A0ABQ6VC08_9CORY|nr:MULTISPECIES: enoyl-CoA hydratase-related protein [Corynebacterium]KAB3519782.1 enoyl-CoA hydratase [Corynebacterium zhongnanshanii]MCR5914708.1 enoyl-CoA hydratase [Corynebacterium sp. zg254]